MKLLHFVRVVTAYLFNAVIPTLHMINISSQLGKKRHKNIILFKEKFTVKVCP